MNRRDIEYLIRIGQLRKRRIDLERVRSMLALSLECVRVVERIPLDEESATVVFREVYESIRQLGDAKLWFLGYEPLTHEACVSVLKGMSVCKGELLNRLGRFKKMRHDANYRGLRVLTGQAKDILDFWERCGKEIAQLLLSKLNSRR